MFNHIYRQRRVLVTGHTGFMFPGCGLAARLQADVRRQLPAGRPALPSDLLALPGARHRRYPRFAARNVIRA